MKLARLTFLLALMAAFSCTPFQPDPVPDPAPSAMTLSERFFTVSQVEETLLLTVSSPARPKVSGLPQWIQFTDGTYANYKITFTLQVQANPDYDTREAEFTVSAAGVASQTVKVTQVGRAKPENPDPGTDPAGWENAASAAIHMGTGWNLGNPLESTSGDVNNMWIESYSSRTPSDYETAWGQPVTTRELMHMFKEAGFGAIRVPVTWYPHMGTVTVSGNHWDMGTWTGYDVDPVWMARVKEVVDYVIDEGMYCILNVHHDTGDASTAWLRADKAVFVSVKERYCSLWTQIATEFSGYGEKLVFESFNEMLDATGTWNSSTDDALEAINLYNAAFVSTVRATGGNNVHRNLILNTYCAGNQPAVLQAFRLPEDQIEGHLMAEVHSYSPYRFAFDNDNPITVFDASCEQEIKTQMENLNTYLVSKGIPCVIGEYGCTTSRPEAETAKQASCYVTSAARYNIPCFYWMVLSDGEDRSVPKWTQPALKDAIIKAYNENKQDE